MKISTIIVTYNAEHLINDCLNSVINSSIVSNIIIVDNCSIDGTVNNIKKNFSDIHLIENSENLGFGAANNIGIRIAIEQNAEFILLLNQDAFLKEKTLEKLTIEAKKNEDYGIVSPIHLNGDGSSFDPNFSSYISSENCPGFIADSYLGKMKDLYPISFVNAAAWLISLKCIETVGGFNPFFFLYGEDDDYCNRLHYHKFKIGICSHATINHLRNHSDNKLSVSKKKKILQRKYFLVHKVALTNININMRSSLFFLIQDVFKKIILGFISLNFLNVYFYLEGTIQIIIRLKTISKNRNLSKQKQRTFI